MYEDFIGFSIDLTIVKLIYVESVKQSDWMGCDDSEKYSSGMSELFPQFMPCNCLLNFFN